MTSYEHSPHLHVLITVVQADIPSPRPTSARCGPGKEVSLQRRTELGPVLEPHPDGLEEERQSPSQSQPHLHGDAALGKGPHLPETEGWARSLRTVVGLGIHARPAQKLTLTTFIKHERQDWGVSCTRV